MVFTKGWQKKKKDDGMTKEEKEWLEERRKQQEKDKQEETESIELTEAEQTAGENEPGDFLNYIIEGINKFGENTTDEKIISDLEIAKIYTLKRWIKDSDETEKPE